MQIDLPVHGYKHQNNSDNKTETLSDDMDDDIEEFNVAAENVKIISNKDKTTPKQLKGNETKK